MKRDLMHILQITYARQTGFSPRIALGVFRALSLVFRYAPPTDMVTIVVLTMDAFRIFETSAIRTQPLRDEISRELRETRALYIKNLLMALAAFALIMFAESSAMKKGLSGYGYAGYWICVAWAIISLVVAFLDYRKRRERDIRITDKVVALEESMDEEARKSRYYSSIKRQWERIHAVN